jgi:hypothetical protein
VPHRYCSNHFVRDLAKPMLEADNHTKVQMRKKVRDLRVIEREVSAEQAAGTAPGRGGGGRGPGVRPWTSTGSTTGSSRWRSCIPTAITRRRPTKPRRSTAIG